MVHSLCKDKSFKIPIPNSGFRLMSTQFGEIWRCFDFWLHFVDCILDIVRFPAAFRCDTVMLQKLLDAKADPVAKAKQVGTALMMVRGIRWECRKGRFGVMMSHVGWLVGVQG